MKNATEPIFVDRELSWLAFNARVLQEAQDPRVPLYERLKFLAIYSANLDEFFRVRVASLRSLLRLKKKAVDKLGIHPAELLSQIHDTVTAQQELFGATFRNDILPELEERGIYLVDDTTITDTQREYLTQYFDEHVRAHIHPHLLGSEHIPFLENREIYLAVELWPKNHRMGLSAEEPRIGLVEVPSPPVDRFVEIPSVDDRHYVIFLDDVVRVALGNLYSGFDVGSAYAIKLSRDAELYLGDEFAGSLAEQIKKSLKKRERGLPCRFLYDLHASHRAISYLKETFDLADEDLVLGGRYHNLHDLSDFPDFGLDGVHYQKLPPLPHPGLDSASSMFDAVGEKDRILHYPYQKFDYVVRFVEEAAEDPAVDSIWITLYRTASESAVVKALLDAARRGKQVTAVVEVKARFDEASNLEWAEQMEASGVRTLYSFRDLKVHAKLLLVGRHEDEQHRWYAYLSTGNFNEITARVYADHGLFTADPRIAEDVRRVFSFLEGEDPDPVFEHLLVAPFHLRKRLNEFIDAEIAAVAEGDEGRIMAKLNALEDEKMILKLYEASRAGVGQDLIVRGICCLVPGLEGQSETIHIRSIVDRFLEHARIYNFHNRGDEQFFLASADLMKRNLNRRVEVAFPVFDPEVRRELREIIDFQCRDNVKARIVDADQSNAYVSDEGAESVRAQTETYDWLRRRWKEAQDERESVVGRRQVAE